MSQRRSRVSKVSLAMLKGKPSTASVPSFRFNAGDDDLKEFSEELGGEEMVLKSPVEFGSGEGLVSHESPRVLTSSSSADGSKELLLAKENSNKFSKRSSSLDSSTNPENSGNDAWSLFYEIKGKITKTVEEKLHIDLGSNGTAIPDKGANGRERASPIFETPMAEDKIEELEENSPEVAEEAVEGFDEPKKDPSPSPNKKSPNTNCNPSSLSARYQASTDKFHAISADLKQRRTRFLSKGDTPVMSMSSLMATKADDDDMLEEELHSEYIQEMVQQESSVETTIPAAQDDNSLGDSTPVDDNLNQPSPDPIKIEKSKFCAIQRRWIFYSCLMIAYFVMPFSPYLISFALGAIISGVVVNFYYKLITPTKVTGPTVPTDFKNQPVFQLPVIPNKAATVYKGWMNELRQPYNPMEYHVSQTNSIFVRLEGTMLRVSHPKGKIPKHASFNESRHEVSFSYQRYYNLSGCQISLLPAGLTRKRLWSRKYPICITLCEGACRTGHICSSSSLTSDVDGNASSNAAQEVSVVGMQEECVYFFTRTCRDKEEWYWRLFMATQLNFDKIRETKSAPSSPKHLAGSEDYPANVIVRAASPDIVNPIQHSPANSVSVPDVSQLVSEAVSCQDVQDDASLTFFTPEYQLAFSNYMKRLLSSSTTPSSSGDTGKKSASTHDFNQTKNISDSSAALDVVWLNAFLGRSFWDFLQDPYWTVLVKAKIQKKLSKIKVPYFMEELSLTDLDFGSQLPVVQQISNPEMDERGLWLFLETTYEGLFRMTLETKVNLLKLKKDETSSEMKDFSSASEHNTSKSAIFDSDEEDSAESSTDDEGIAETNESANEDGALGNLASVPGGSGTSKKLLRIVDKITQSRYFQQATEYKYVRRAVQEVANTRLILTVEVHAVAGTIALNIPPPPTDRLWYGFRTNPQVTIVAKPRLGEREVTVSSVTEWIEKKLIQEFQKVFVVPNMDDIPIPFMSPGLSQTPCRTASAQAQESPIHFL